MNSVIINKGIAFLSLLFLFDLTYSALLLRQLSVFVPAARVGLSRKNNKILLN